MPPLQMLTVRLPVSLVEAVQQLADAAGPPSRSWCAVRCWPWWNWIPAARQYATVLYEMAKTRCVLLRLLDTQMTPAQVDQLLSLAEGDATGYVREL